MSTHPTTTLDERYGEPEATPTSWEDAAAALSAAELFWLTTVRPEGRPHCTPLLAVWHDDALHISTGPEERKARNLAVNSQVVLTTGRNDLHGGLDLVVEGVAERVTDHDRLRDLATAWEEKYGPEWHYDVGEGGFIQRGTPGVLVFRVEPTTAFGFGKAPYSQTRWRF
jgi:nitroimidazol reductase NimA-like FMN-containing flavoprotein (pyridoxamine 5'-phosphate oxidase superfamily)